MENKDKCKIVQDLLPNYIDKLTSEETNSFVKKHLEECNECHEIIENMKKDFEKEKKEINKKTIKYAKKINNKITNHKCFTFLLYFLAYFIVFLLSSFLSFSKSFFIFSIIS